MESQSPAETGNRIAIIIGCSEYASGGLSDLQFAEKDAKAIAERLRNPKIGNFKNIYSFNSNSSLREIEVTIDKVLTASRNDDKVVIYFSGHGIKHPENRQLYLAVNETDKQAPRHTSIWANGLLDQLEDARASRKCVILDCCYSGAFGRKAATAEMLDYNKDLEPHQGKGVVVLASSKEYEESLESEPHGHSLFTHYLLEGMDGAADENEDGVITPSELYKYAYDRVRDEAGGEMSPKIPLNKLEGPEFYLVRSQRREQKTLVKWRNKIKKMQDKHHHLQALEWLDAKIRHFGDQPPPIAKELTKLHKQVEKDLSRQWRDYKVRLNDEWGKDQISRDLKQRAEEYVNGDPEFMFSDLFQTDPLALDLRQHFIGDINSHALNNRWPRERLQQPTGTPGGKTVKPAKPEKPTPPQTFLETDHPGKHPGWLPTSIPKQRLLRWTLFIAGIGIIVLAMLSIQISSTFDPKQIRFGISARNIDWDRSTAYLMGQFRDELNHALEIKGSKFRLAAARIQDFEDSGVHFDDLANALRTGQVDLLGELTPREIFKLSERTDLRPFIGPQHRPTSNAPAQSTYRTLLFGLAENYPQAYFLRPGELVNEIKQGKRIVVAGKESTSGYWWPRHWVLKRMQNTATDLSFSEISIVEDKAHKILQKIMCNPDKVTAGALAEFRFRRLIDENGSLRHDDDRSATQGCGANKDARIQIIHELQKIPNGAYVLGAQAAGQPQLANDLRDVWSQAIIRLHDRADACMNESDNCDLQLSSSFPITHDKIKRYLPNNWVPRELSEYTGGVINEVFNIDDPNTSNRSRTIYYLLIVCAVILAIGLMAATLMRRDQLPES